MSSGEVLPIGGLPEKLMAAQRAGITTVLIPKKNEEDLKEVPEEITGKLSIIPVETIAQVAKRAWSCDEITKKSRVLHNGYNILFTADW